MSFKPLQNFDSGPLCIKTTDMFKMRKFKELYVLKISLPQTSLVHNPQYTDPFGHYEFLGIKSDNISCTVQVVQYTEFLVRDLKVL